MRKVKRYRANTMGSRFNHILYFHSYGDVSDHVDYVAHYAWTKNGNELALWNKIRRV